MVGITFMDIEIKVAKYGFMGGIQHYVGDIRRNLIFMRSGEFQKDRFP